MKPFTLLYRINRTNSTPPHFRRTRRNKASERNIQGRVFHTRCVSVRCLKITYNSFYCLFLVTLSGPTGESISTLSNKFIEFI